MTLAGRTALVTGSIQGIGLAVARGLAAAGARVVLHGPAPDRSSGERVAELVAAGAPAAKYFECDLRDSAAIDPWLDAVMDWAAIDILVNNAGIQFTSPLAAMPVERWQAILAVNLEAAFRTMRRCLPAMGERGFGRVVNIASVHGLVASVDKAPYVASKFGLVGLSKVAALEYAASGSRDSGGVTVNCIAPGWTETDIIEPQLAARGAKLGVDRTEAASSLLAEKQPSLRMSLPSEIARLAVWLCDPAAHNLTGAVIPIDGGWTAQ